MTSPQAKIAIVTGAGSGIGRHVAIELSRNGFRLILAGRRIERLEATAKLCSAGTSLVVPCDVTDAESVAHLFAETIDRHQRLDLLFNNAGIGTAPLEIDDLTLDQWRRVVDVNLTERFLRTRGFRIMKLQTPAEAESSTTARSAHVLVRYRSLILRRSMRSLGLPNR
ncbi:MAG: SDR family NAD(P)-dependent oxidoreductase [Pirellulaceae bacterium]